MFIYFENYRILDSAVYLPRFLEDLAMGPTEPRVRTINAMFKRVGLLAQDISDLGREEAEEAKAAGPAGAAGNDRARSEAQGTTQREAELGVGRYLEEI